MYIKNIKLNNFRNYEYLDINLINGINIFYGNNAQGKTNIIESIYVCSMGKSFRTYKEKEMIKFSKEKSIIKIEYGKSDREGSIKIEVSDKKQMEINGIKINKISELLGNIIVVLFSPDDIDILKQGPSLRRKFLDIMISSLKPAYLYNLSEFLKTMEQRNIFIRQLNIDNKNIDMLDIWDEKLANHAEKVYNYRKEFINKIKNKIEKIHENITEEKEKIDIKYISECENKENYLELLKKSRRADIFKGYTTKGIHRDDFIIYINDKQVNIYGSQGQCRTTILSLKLAQLEVIYNEINEYPILLLDDFMSELDEKRQKNFLENIKNNQVLITCTEKIELEKLNHLVYNVVEGNIYKE